MKKVLVLMSTYNGEKYAVTQIRSVLEQKNVNVSMYIRDDGSNDNTVSVVESFEDNRITLFCEENIGALNSFLKLLHKAPLEYDYYAFCDQDDMWEADKLYSATLKLDLLDNKVPAIYYSGQKLTDSNLQIVSNHNIDTERSTAANFVFNQTAGCTTVFNQKLLMKLQSYSPRDILWHDAWCFKVCAALEGNIVVESKGHILYRQHGKNVVGLENSFRGKISRVPKYLFENDVASYAYNILEAYGNEIGNEWKTFLCLICSASQGNLLDKWKLLKSELVKFNSLPLRILYIIKVIFGKL